MGETCARRVAGTGRGAIMSLEKPKWIWHCGQLVSWRDATVHVSAPSVQYGAAVFEGIRCYQTEDGPAVFRLGAHLDRLYASAAHYEMEIPYERWVLADAVSDLIRRNNFQSCYIRPICYYDSGRPGVLAEQCPVKVDIIAWPSVSTLRADSVNSGVRVTVSKWRKFHYQMMPTTAK